MELFDKKFVHFMWDDELEGKTGHVSNDIKCLHDYVNNNPSATELIEHSSDESQPFKTTDGIKFRFFYYDPNYEVKKAFNEGKKVQMKVDGFWANCDKPDFEDGEECRVKPEEEKWIAYLARQKNGLCYLTACTEDNWESAQKAFGAKTKLFIDVHDKVSEWFESRQKFAEVIKAWEDNKQIQFLDYGQWEDCRGKPLWCLTNVYREKPECPCEKGIDSEACVGCEHSEDGKKKYRPYESSTEMIVDFIDRFKVRCPSYCEPLIWVRLKVDKRRRLIVAYGDNFVEIGNKTKAVTLQHLFEQYELLDGSSCGMEVKE